MDYALVFHRLLPETALVITALLVLSADLLPWRGFSIPVRKTLAALEISAGCWVAYWLLGSSGETGHHYNGLWVIDPTIVFLKRVLLGLSLGTVWLTREAEFTEHVGEYFALLLFSTVGMMGLISTENLLLAFLSLELLSLSLYVMTAFDKGNSASAEAGLKYFLFGGVSAAVLLFGLSLLFVLTGELQLLDIAAKLSGTTPQPLLLLALVFVAAGLGFKIAAVPFHLWAPDTYQGAPTSSAALVASGSKVASFYLLGKVMMVGFQNVAGSGGWHALTPGWVPLLSLLAAGSLILGNWVAIAQSSLKRLLAYSAIAHAGYMLVGLVGNRPEGAQALMYYVVTYAFTSLGAFAIVSILEHSSDGDRLDQLAGLGQRSPWLAGCLTVFILSLAGIPPLAGFFGKFYLFTGALHTPGKPLSLLWLVLLAVAMSCVALYYYLQILKWMFVVKPALDAPRIHVRWATRLIVGGCALLVILWGCFPQWLLSRLPFERG